MKISTLKIFFFSLTVILTSLACSNDAPEENLQIGQLTAKINGETFESINALGTITVEDFVIDTLHNFIFLGAVNEGITSSKTISLAFGLPANDLIETTTYSYDDTVSDCEPGINVCGVIDYTYSDFVNPQSSEFYDSAFGNLSVTFTEIDYQPGGSAKGTFSGVVLDNNNNEISITDGKFNIKIGS